MTLTPLAQMLNASGCFGTDKLGPFLLRQDDGTMQAVPALYLKTPCGGCRTAAPPEVLQAAMDLPIEEAPLHLALGTLPGMGDFHRHVSGPILKARLAGKL